MSKQSRSLIVAFSGLCWLTIGCGGDDTAAPTVPVIPGQDAGPSPDSSGVDASGGDARDDSNHMDGVSPEDAQDAFDSGDGADAMDGSMEAGDAGDSGPPPVSPDCARLDTLDTTLAGLTDEGSRLAALDSFLFGVGESDGLPIRCSDEVTFFFRRPGGFGDPPHVAGDFNSFDPLAAPMTWVAGTIYRATLPMDTGPNRYLYKYTDGTNWVADPLARRYGYDNFGEYSLVTGGLTQGHLERHLPIGGAGLAPRPLTLYVPPGYEASPDSYPVLYVHDGQNLFDPSAMWGGWELDQTIEQLLSEQRIVPFLVVGIHNTAARMDEYTHVADVLSGTSVGGDGDTYYSLVSTRVMPFIEGRYRVYTDPENTWTMGSSLGGLISLYFGMMHPDVFGRVAGLSSTVGWGSIGANNTTLIELLPTLGKPDAVFYLDSGGDDGGPPGCVDSDGDGIWDDAPSSFDNFCETEQLRDVFLGQGYVSGVDLHHWHEPGAEHNEAAWAARVFRPLEVLAAP